MEEDEATLASVQAFVDAFNVAEELQEAPVEQVEASSSSSKRLEARRRRVEAKYTTKLQRQKRAELSDLREQVAVLEARLRRLQLRTRAVGSSGNGGEKKMWAALEERAASELAARRRAEVENRKLWWRLERHGRLHKDIERLIDKYKQEVGPEDGGRFLLVALKSSTVATIPTFVKNGGVPSMAAFMGSGCNAAHREVPMVLRYLVDQADNVIASAFVRPQSCWLETNTLGNSAEILMSTTADCSVSTAANMLWSNFRKRQCSEIIVDEVYSETSGGMHSIRRCIMPIQCRSWDDRNKGKSSSVQILLHLEHLSRRVYDRATGRAVMVTFSQIRLPSEGREVLLRERFWKCITPLDSCKNTKSITQTRYHIEPGDVKAKELSPAQRSVMRALVQLTRRNHAKYQEYLLEA